LAQNNSNYKNNNNTVEHNIKTRINEKFNKLLFVATDILSSMNY